MAQPSPAKRARSSTNGDSTLPTPSGPPPPSMRDLSDAIKILKTDQLRSLLMSACQKHPDVWAPVQDIYHRKTAAQKATVMNFDHLSKSIWKDINVTYNKLSGSKQYDVSFDIVESIHTKVSSVVRDAGTTMASEGTRKNGLEILRRFAKTIMMSEGDVVGREVQKQLQSDRTLVYAMKKIVRAMGVAERTGVLRDAKGASTEFATKFPEVIGLTKKHSCFKGMDEVLVMLEGGNVDLDEEEYEDDEEQEEEGEDEDEYGESDEY